MMSNLVRHTLGFSGLAALVSLSLLAACTPPQTQQPTPTGGAIDRAEEAKETVEQQGEKIETQVEQVEQQANPQGE